MLINGPVNRSPFHFGMSIDFSGPNLEAMKPFVEQILFHVQEPNANSPSIQKSKVLKPKATRYHRVV